LREIIVQKIADLEKDIKECFLPIEQPLKEGVEEAKKSYKAAIRSILSVGIKQFSALWWQWQGLRKHHGAVSGEGQVGVRERLCP